jgi:hypothetical protein
VTSTLQPSLSSSTAFAMYVLAVEPAQACSLSVTVPQSLPVDAVLLEPPPLLAFLVLRLTAGGDARGED